MAEQKIKDGQLLTLKFKAEGSCITLTDTGRTPLRPWNTWGQDLWRQKNLKWSKIAVGHFAKGSVWATVTMSVWELRWIRNVTISPEEPWALACCQNGATESTMTLTFILFHFPLLKKVDTFNQLGCVRKAILPSNGRGPLKLAPKFSITVITGFCFPNCGT